MPSAATNVLSAMNARLHRLRSEPERPEHADRAAAFANRPHHDDTEAGDADEQTERQEALHQPEEALARGEVLLDGLPDRCRNETRSQEPALQLGDERDVVDAGSVEHEARHSRVADISCRRRGAREHREAELADADVVEGARRSTSCRRWS